MSEVGKGVRKALIRNGGIQGVSTCGAEAVAGSLGGFLLVGERGEATRPAR